MQRLENKEDFIPVKQALEWMLSTDTYLNDLSFSDFMAISQTCKTMRQWFKKSKSLGAHIISNTLAVLNPVYGKQHTVFVDSKTGADIVKSPMGEVMKTVMKTRFYLLSQFYPEMIKKAASIKRNPSFRVSMDTEESYKKFTIKAKRFTENRLIPMDIVYRSKISKIRSSESQPRDTTDPHSGGEERINVIGESEEAKFVQLSGNRFKIGRWPKQAMDYVRTVWSLEDTVLVRLMKRDLRIRMRYPDISWRDLEMGYKRIRDPSTSIIAATHSAAVMKNMRQGHVPKTESMVNYLMGTYHMDGLPEVKETHLWAKKIYRLMQNLCDKYSPTEDDGKIVLELGKVGLRFKGQTDVKIGSESYSYPSFDIRFRRHVGAGDGSYSSYLERLRDLEYRDIFMWDEIVDIQRRIGSFWDKKETPGESERFVELERQRKMVSESLTPFREEKERLQRGAHHNMGLVTVSTSGHRILYISKEGMVWVEYDQCHGEITRLLTKMSDDFGGVTSLLGRVSGVCLFCGLTLTDKQSRSLGYGPTCARTMNHSIKLLAQMVNGHLSDPDDEGRADAMDSDSKVDRQSIETGSDSEGEERQSVMSDSEAESSESEVSSERDSKGEESSEDESEAEASEAESSEAESSEAEASEAEASEAEASEAEENERESDIAPKIAPNGKKRPLNDERLNNNTGEKTTRQKISTGGVYEQLNVTPNIHRGRKKMFKKMKI